MHRVKWGWEYCGSAYISSGGGVDAVGGYEAGPVAERQGERSVAVATCE